MSDASELTLEGEPTAAAEIAGERITVLRAFAADLAERGEELGLIGPVELPRLWTRHLLNSAVLAPLIQSGARVADIGTGGGMPGLVLAIVRPDAQFLLIEPMERRCAWLNEQIDRLELENVEVRRGRAEEFHDAFEVDQVTARAVTALRKLVPITAPLLRDGGEMLFLKGAAIDAEIEAAAKTLRKYRASDVTVEELGVGQLAETTRVFRAKIRSHD
ncbi:16S rRNA (guanine(527)-N(7))-methyltransferase RsmG [Leucobacter luti]|uniref:Ribosomal RNA small subunit methyltransferase G n=1 Tax=Leucobacter luti TaxID=340320 RepID=A0A4V3CY86_9MICO|nr:16S rRNA (guanine(527)-N(7))-methyltransferase RsmG [Leucobacter luti]MCW2289333.1 16S rRNA (guanine527-N7)-methyltransferase [Leucobacter luti]QYM74871.1 16S rRNA (guanine(527)-N(7))-methyltransferase RsmG [Leucobacter luti]TCK39893.1 16S rRNA m(7)G-527 methyltransferase [Leucobacter luti]TDP93248.1 16S rRNA m(7)G-527 methyltransferase [Leucobacter luti]